MHSRRTWSEDQLATIAKLYPEMGARDLARSGMLGDHSECAIRQKAYKLGIKYAVKDGVTQPFARTPWSRAEKAIMRARYVDMGPTALSRSGLLNNRSVHAIEQAAFKMGLNYESVPASIDLDFVESMKRRIRAQKEVVCA